MVLRSAAMTTKTRSCNTVGESGHHGQSSAVGKRSLNSKCFQTVIMFLELAIDVDKVPGNS